MKRRVDFSVIMITQNAEATIAKALESVAWADEILIIDEESTDKTIDIAMEFTGEITTTTVKNFAKKRNLGMNMAQGKWLFYLDSDEVVTPELKAEMQAILKQGQKGAYRLTRLNYFLGTKMYPDQVTRWFYRENLKEWQGEVHESPVISGELKQFQSPLLHHTHRDITSMLHKTNDWSEIEADLRLKAKHPTVAWWRLVRIALTEGWHQFGQLKVGRFGRGGLI